MLRVLHVINGLDHGGAEVYTTRLIESLEQLGVASHLAYTHRGPLSERVERLSVPMLQASERRFSFRSPVSSLMASQKIYSYVRRERIQIVHAHIFEPYFWTVPAMWFSGVPVVRTVVGTRRDAHSWTHIPERVLGRVTSGFVVFSEMSRREILRFGVDRCRTRVIPNGVTFTLDGLPDVEERAKELRSRLGLTGKRVVGYVGRFHWMKGPLDFLTAAKEVSRQLPDVHFVMDGDGPMREEVQRASRELEGRITFTGWSEDVLALMKMFDLFVLPSLSEGMPTVLLEAMALQVPVVATSVGAVPEVICDGVHGTLVSAGDTSGLSRVVVKCLECSSRTQGMAVSARQRCERRYNFVKVARETSDFYRAIRGHTGALSG